MKKKGKKILALIGILLLIFVIAEAFKPAVYMDPDTGYVYWRWSGLKAIFTEDQFGIRKNYYRETEYDGADGPYIFSGRYAYYVTDKNKLECTHLSGDSIKIEVPNADHDFFYVHLKDSLITSKTQYDKPPKILAISDIEGNFDGLYSFLLSNGVIDEKYNWTFGDGHVVFLGDFMDRGEYVTQVLWLIYSLEEKAKEHDGMVHFILGNHEMMNLQGENRYARNKYVKVAQDISGMQEWNKAYEYLYSKSSELGKWLRTKNAMEKIGSYLFVHGGISPRIMRYNASLSAMNENILQNIDKKLYNNPGRDSLANFLAGREGPLWYRGMADDYKYYKKITQSEFEKVLVHMNIEKVVIGHTIVDDIQSDFDNRLIKIDVHHGTEKQSGKTKGLFIIDGKEYVVNDIGEKREL